MELLDRHQLSDITTLILSFKNIHLIDNLQGFNKLIRLQLDNNMIETITGLDHLVNLQWLDLSFNQITVYTHTHHTLITLTLVTTLTPNPLPLPVQVLEGLDKLTQLTDLSLYHNH